MASHWVLLMQSEPHKTQQHPKCSSHRWLQTKQKRWVPEFMQHMRACQMHVLTWLWWSTYWHFWPREIGGEKVEEKTGSCRRGWKSERKKWKEKRMKEEEGKDATERWTETGNATRLLLNYSLLFNCQIQIWKHENKKTKQNFIQHFIGTHAQLKSKKMHFKSLKAVAFNLKVTVSNKAANCRSQFSLALCKLRQKQLVTGQKVRYYITSAERVKTRLKA